MCRVIVFAGTTEGYEIGRFLARHGVSVRICVATEYGGRFLKEGGLLHVTVQRLTAEEMRELFERERPGLVLDATHPYAAEVTKNILQACEETGIPCQRILREQGARQSRAVYVESTEAAVEFLKTTSGNILLTTGSKELAKFTALPDYQNRLYARVLSLPSVLETCRELGIEGKNLIGMQGPFSRELNSAMLRQFDCRYLVTKDTGKAGGFQEKMDAAMECGVIPVVIGRPLREQGLSLRECKKDLMDRFGFLAKPRITLVGIGMGSLETATLEGAEAVAQADLLIGAGRMVEAVQSWYSQGLQKKGSGGGSGQDVSSVEGRGAGTAAGTCYGTLPADVLREYRRENIAEYIEAHPEYENIVILLSGDVGFYSGAKGLLERLKGDVRVICGISSAVYFMSKIGLSWDDARLASAHGRQHNLISLIRQYPKVFSILGSGADVAKLSRKLEYYGMGEVLLYVGENLSYKNEKIFVKPARELTDYQGDTLSVVCACNGAAKPYNATHGIGDEEFLRGSAPMTKEEVRAVSLAKLRLKEDSICYDVGAGTGSVAVEMALRAHQGRVYAIEKKASAADLIEENKRKFGVDHLEIIRGEAPDALGPLPAPTHAFIGGSSGNLKQIVQALLKKNAQVRIVINCITLETVTEALETARELPFRETQIVQMGVARSRELGRYHMMMGENPIYVITLQGPETGNQDSFPE